MSAAMPVACKRVECDGGVVTQPAAIKSAIVVTTRHAAAAVKSAVIVVNPFKLLAMAPKQSAAAGAFKHRRVVAAVSSHGKQSRVATTAAVGTKPLACKCRAAAVITTMPPASSKRQAAATIVLPPASSKSSANSLADTVDE